MAKTIVLFSDGTGNSASKPFKTNVWRTYQALDLAPPPPDTDLRPQIAYYRDGVGTETFKPLAALGGAFGFGVMHDVRELYTYLCRNYVDGDKIYAFGFSRGAFTVRLLVGMVARCGIVQASGEAELRRAVAFAYKAFRRDFLIRASERRGMIYNHILAPPYYTDDLKQVIRIPFHPLRAKIAFLGVWDTVDAYGMPVDELKDGIDEWIWPMTLADRELSPIVERARHALSLDDERPTFRPVLWNEEHEVAAEPPRLEQVWFSGVHANVGGGYPIDDLAHVPLAWIMEEAERAGLRFEAGTLPGVRLVADPQGTAYDSRSGVAGYYRYGPRSVQQLCNDAKNHVTVVNPTIHPSVVARIARRQVDYAPVSLPLDVHLPATTAQQVSAYVDWAADAIFWRRVVYFATVFVTLALVSMPWWHGTDGGTLLALYHQYAEGTVTGWYARWVMAYLARPWIAGALFVGLAWLFFVKSRQLQQWVTDRSEMAWSGVKAMPPPPLQPQLPVGDRWARRLRTSRLSVACVGFTDYAVPHIVGIGLILAGFWACKWGIDFILTWLHGPWLVAACVVALGSSALFFFRNVRLRAEIDAALRTSPTPKVPERRWSYDKAYLEQFKRTADAIALSDGRTALQNYHEPVLLNNDVFFAIGLSLFVSLLGLFLHRTYQDPHGLFLYAAIVGVFYGFADVLEDLILSRIFVERSFSTLEAGAANFLTRCKMTFLGLSVIGGAVFLCLTALSKVIRPRV